MNASQSKQLIAAARRAVCFLDPNTRIYQDLKIALARLDEAPANKEKCCFCEKPVGANALSGFSKKLKPRMACWPCAARFEAAKSRFGTWNTPGFEPRVYQGDKAAERERLSYCTCEHAAARHAEDRDGNLMKCADCDCDHFRSPVKEAA